MGERGRLEKRKRLLAEYSEMFERDDHTEATKTWIREMELHELTALHAELTAFVAGLEGEMEFRVEHDRRLVAGNDSHREYARNVVADDDG